MKGMKMVMSFKINKKIKQALQTLADKEYRSLSNYVIMVLKKHLEEKGLDWREEGKDQNETESKETFLSDFGKLSQGLSEEQIDEALREVGQMQKDGLIKVSKPQGGTT